jgi:hypothetical protein
MSKSTANRQLQSVQGGGFRKVKKNYKLDFRGPGRSPQFVPEQDKSVPSLESVPVSIFRNAKKGNWSGNCFLTARVNKHFRLTGL